MGSMRAVVVLLLAALAAVSCNNDPHTGERASDNVLYSAFLDRSPRHLDPTASYWNNETPFTFSIYEPLYGYHYLKRPYELIPKVARSVVAPRYVGKDGQPLPPDAPGDQVAESVYDIPIEPGIRYQPHPAFAVDEQGHYRYHAMKPGEIGERRSPLQFEHMGTRELVAEDFVYALKRHATTRITTPIAGIFAEYVIGLKAYIARIKTEDAKLRQGLDPASLDKPFLDFREWPLAGATAPEKYLLRIRLHGKYPQWKYWLAMPFTAPVPWEADAFYAQPGMAANGLSLDTWPVGTGPYMMVASTQDRRHVIARNPNYRGVPYPCEGMPQDKSAGLLDDCGKTMPFIEKIIFLIEKEKVPLKSKFRQGYLDVPVIERTDYGVDFSVDMEDSEDVRREYTAKGFKFPKVVDLSNWFIGFNMLDPVIGRGSTPEQQLKNRKLRQALSIAIDWEEFTRIFPEDGGEVAMGPVPAGLFGSHHGTPEDLNAVTHKRNGDRLVRRSIEDAKELLAQAGYPGGRNAQTGQPLTLNYDYYAIPTPDRKPKLEWMVKQFAKIGVQLDIRATDNNQFQEKVRKGKHQVFWSGWLADYPDAENFLFLLYGPNGKTRSDGENTANYENPEFDRLYAQLKLTDDGPAKQKLIDEMVRMAQDDAPWAFGYFPFASGAFQPWVKNGKPSILIRDMARYYRVDTDERARLQAEWNRPVWWPVIALFVALVLLAGYAVRSFRRRERMNARGEEIAA